MSTSLNVKVGNVSLKSPLILASGTCNFGRELAEYYDLSILGGIFLAAVIMTIVSYGALGSLF